MARAGGLSAADLEAFAEEVLAGLPAGRLVVALSGGADSAALALAVARAGVPARAITVHHHLGGSDALVAAATGIAGRLGLAHTIVDAPAGGSETELRQARLEALEKSIDPDEWILTGHTRDDLAETVLGNLLRGAGAGGLSGIPRRRRPWARPLLAVPRERTRGVARAAGLPFVDDPQNDDLEVRRNRIRREVIPALERDFNPSLRASLARTAALAAADDDALADRAAAVPIVVDDEAVLVPAAALETLPPAVATRVVRRALRAILDPYPGTASAAVVDAVSGTTGQVAGGFLAEREGPYVAIHAGEPPGSPEPVDLRVPGEAVFGRWVVSAGSAAAAGLGRHGAVISGRALCVRSALVGDRIAVPGGSKKVVDALAEARVPRRLRSRWPVVVADGTIAWIVAVRVAAGEGGGVGLSAVKR